MPLFPERIIPRLTCILSAIAAITFFICTFTRLSFLPEDLDHMLYGSMVCGLVFVSVGSFFLSIDRLKALFPRAKTRVYLTIHAALLGCLCGLLIVTPLIALVNCYVGPQELIDLEGPVIAKEITYSAKGHINYAVTIEDRQLNRPIVFYFSKAVFEKTKEGETIDLVYARGSLGLFYRKI